MMHIQRASSLKLKNRIPGYFLVDW